MATTYTLISSNTLSASAASVTFSSIPSTYTDLVLRVSGRSNRATFMDSIYYELNADTSAANYSRTYLEGSDGSAFSGRVATGSQSYIVFGYVPGADQEANTFGNGEIYLPSYTVAIKKPISSIEVSENNATTKYAIQADAGLYQSTTAISQIKIGVASGSFVSGSSFYLYGLKNS